MAVFLILSLASTAQSDDVSYERHRSMLKYFAIGEAEMAFIDEGEGPAILLVHGVPTNSWLYRKVTKPLVESGYRVVVPDMLGYGQSSRHEDNKWYDPEQQSKCILALMKHLHIDEWSLVVHDAGGIWSWPMVIQMPEKIKDLTILNTIIYTEGFDPPVNAKYGSFKNRIIGWVYKSFPRMMVGQTLKSGTVKHKFTKKEKEGYWAPVKNDGHLALKYFFGHFKEVEGLCRNVQSVLAKTKIRVQVIWGKEDEFLLADVQVPLIKRDFNVAAEDLIVLFETGHFVTEERPNIIADKISRFVGRQ